MITENVIYANQYHDGTRVKIDDEEEKGLQPEVYAMKYFSQKGFKSFWSEGLFVLLLSKCFYFKFYPQSIVPDDEIAYVKSKLGSFFAQGATQVREEFFQIKYKESLKNRSQALMNMGEDEIIERLNWFDFDSFFDKTQVNLHARDLLEIIKIFGMEIITNICEFRLKNHFKLYSRGFPDLIVYDSEKGFFCEVKSHNDKLSVFQKEWIEFLSGISDVEILNIRKPK